tara:strand:+ start:138 stop:380 length:243 start_codon:yes stop_codon:yes gene_type:complete
MGCCCCKYKKNNENLPIIKLDDDYITDSSFNFMELGTCFFCRKNGIDVFYYTGIYETVCNKCYKNLIDYRLDNLESLENL